MRRHEVAALAGVNVEQVQAVDVEQVQRALAERIDDTVLSVALQEPAHYWQVGDRFFLDDPFFGDVVEFTQLEYDPALGLVAR